MTHYSSTDFKPLLDELCGPAQSILPPAGYKGIIDVIVDMYSRKSRAYHDLVHLVEALKFFRKLSTDLPLRDRALGQIALLFHDFVYVPGSSDNEKSSASVAVISTRDYLEERDLEVIRKCVLATNPLGDECHLEGLPSLVSRADLWILSDAPNWRKMEFERGIQLEYGQHNYQTYVTGRTAILNSIAWKHPDCKRGVDFICDFLWSWHPRIGIYAGSFDPFHVGHLSVLRDSERIFDKVVIATAVHPAKKGTSRPVTDRYDDLCNLLKHHEVMMVPDGVLLSEAANGSYPYRGYTIIRGLRTDTDFKAEEKVLRLMTDQDPRVRIVMVPCDKKYEHVSSSDMRMLEGIRPSLSNQYKVSYASVYLGEKTYDRLPSD